MTAAIIVIVCCWIISFFFNGIESGLLSIDPVRLRQNVKRRVPAALRLLVAFGLYRQSSSCLVSGLG